MTDALGSFLRDAGWAEARRAPLAGDASARRYLRLTRADGARAVLMCAAPAMAAELRRFEAVADFLEGCDLSPPRRLASDPDAGLMLLEDLGDDLLARLAAARPAQEAQLYEAATDVLVRLGQVPAPGFLHRPDAQELAGYIDPLWTHWQAPLGAEAGADMRAEVAARLSDALAQHVTPAAPVAALRDYHAENLLWLPDRAGAARIGLLDFQDAIACHPAYDLVSLAQDARRDLSAGLETHLLQRMARATGADPREFEAAYRTLGLQRNLRILGIFGRLARQAGKPQYLAYAPRVAAHIAADLAHPALAPLAPLLRGRLAPATPDTLSRLEAACTTAQAPS